MPSLPAYAPGKQIGADGLQQDPKPGPEASPVTDREAHFVDGVAVGGGGQSPPPTLVGIAAELGRIEDKLARIMGRPSGAGACQFVDRSGVILDRVKDVKDGVDDLLARGEALMGPIHVISEAPANYDGSGNRERFVFDIPRLPVSEFETLLWQRLLEYLHTQKRWRQHVAKVETNPKPLRIQWIEVPFTEGG
jgi:hypothetical protein